MQPNAPKLQLTLSIAAVERDTGLSKDTLRVWERRYGFPRPERDSLGERAYPLDQVERLRIIKRLLDAGHRPGRVVVMGLPDLQQLAETTVDHPLRKPPSPVGGQDLQRLVGLLRAHDPAALRQELARLLVRLGVRAFVGDVVAPLNQAVGDAWMRGQLAIFEEHLYSELIQSALRQALASIPPPPEGTAAPRVLLTTLPGEPHGLGLLMAQAVMALEGCECISLGTQTPVLEIAAAARALRVQAVALGFAGCLGAKQIQDGLESLRGDLPAAVQVWAGGTVTALHRRPVQGVCIVDELAAIQREISRLVGAAKAPSRAEGQGPMPVAAA